MKLGVGLPSKSSDDHLLPGSRLKRYAHRADEYGFAGIWVLEHLIRPPSYKTSFTDPLATLAAVAGAVETIDVGTSIMILPMREPTMVAKRAATIQHVTEGRLTLGLGQGYIRSEYDAVNVPFEERHRRFTEGIDLLDRLLHEETVTYDGEFYSVEDFRLEPALTRPPRVLVAGGGGERDGEWHVATTVKNRIAMGDGWIASSGSTIEKDWTEIATHLEANGRDPEAMEKVGLQHVHLEPGDDPGSVRRRQTAFFEAFLGEDRGFEYAEENLLVGTVEEIQEKLAAYEREGFDQVILHPVASEASEVDRQLDLWRDWLLPAYA